MFISKAYGLHFAGALGLLFIVLKVTGAISWPWIWVLCPLWAWLTVYLLVLLCIGLFLFTIAFVVGVATLIAATAKKE